jgi:hypothetical protein
MAGLHCGPSFNISVLVGSGTLKKAIIVCPAIRTAKTVFKFSHLRRSQMRDDGILTQLLTF